MTKIGMFDTIRIRATAETEQLGIAGRTALVHGWTTPSVAAVQVVGGTANGRALSVQVEGLDEPIWLDPELAEFVDHTPGLAAKVGNRSRIRGANGEWIEDVPTADHHPTP